MVNNSHSNWHGFKADAYQDTFSHRQNEVQLSLLSALLWLQRSFPLTEEEYLLHLDDIANTLKGWGAVSHIRSSLAKTKERPRIGKVNQFPCHFHHEIHNQFYWSAFNVYGV